MLLALLVGALPYQYASAQSPAVQAARESVEKNTESGAVSAPQTDAVDAARTTILSVLDLTAAELEDTLGSKKLGALLLQDDVGLATIAQELADKLVMYRAYVQLVRGQVSRPGISSDALKAIAGGLKEWREQVYDPAMRQAFDALLVTQGASVLTTTQQRLERVNADLKKIQAAIGAEANVLVPMLESARKSVATAMSYHEEARQLLLTNEIQFLTEKPTTTVGVPRPAMLSRGDMGDFFCVSAGTRSSECQLAYRLRNGAQYALKTKTGLPIVLTPGDISSIEGSLIILSPLLPGDEVVGVFFVYSTNSAVSSVENKKAEGAPLSFEASSIDAIGAPVLETPETVQSLIKKEIDQISQAYKTFFSMSKSAKRLMAK